MTAGTSDAVPEGWPILVLLRDERFESHEMLGMPMMAETLNRGMKISTSHDQRVICRLARVVWRQ